MREQFSRRIATGFFCLTLAFFANSSAAFTIAGTVLDSGGNPADGTSVCVDLRSGPWTGVCGGTGPDGSNTTDAFPTSNDCAA
jgi:hypothetical protein